jgi:hypothetical protein
MNVWRQPDAAYLLTDIAWYDEDDGAKVLRFAPKVIELSLLPIAIAFTGCGASYESILDYLEQLNPGLDDADQVISGLPDLLRHMIEFADREWPQEQHEIGLAAAMWSPARERAEAYRCDSTTQWLGDRYTPFAVVAVSEAINSRVVDGRCWGVAQMLGRPVDPTDPQSFDPREDGLRLIEAQRRLKMPSSRLGFDVHAVGGAGILTRVDELGVHHQTLVEWPEDRIGIPINPTACRGDGVQMKRVGRDGWPNPGLTRVRSPRRR